MKKIPNAKKAHGRENPPPDHVGLNRNKRSRSKISKFRKEDDGIDLTPKGRKAFENLLATTGTQDLTWLKDIEEVEPGDRNKIVTVCENLSLGAKHRDALADVSWTWSHFSSYCQRHPQLKATYKLVVQHGESFRRILREDEAHRRAYDGTSEPIYSASGKFCGNKVKYSDALLMMFLKADNPDKFMDRKQVQTSGVVLNVSMGLRDDVRETSLGSDFEVEYE